MIEVSLTPRLATMLILIGPSPASVAAPIPSSTFWTGNETSFIPMKTESSSESRLTVTRCRPAAARSVAIRPNKAPLVVGARSSISGIAASLATSSSMPWRNVGSPPVRRSLVTP